jgi:site-specific DNA-methyltransferase (adenine-specific)
LAAGTTISPQVNAFAGLDPEFLVEANFGKSVDWLENPFFAGPHNGPNRLPEIPSLADENGAGTIEQMAEQWCNRLYLGSCIDTLNNLAAKGARVDLAFADPPYNIGYSYDLYKDNLDDQAYLTWTDSWLGAVNRILKPTGSLWVAIGDEYVAEMKRLAEKQGLYVRNWVIWYYTFGVHCTRKFSRSHTHLLYFVKDQKNFTFNESDVRVRSARQMVYNDGRADPRGRVPDNTWILRPQDAHGAFGADQDTWYFARVAGTFKERAGFHSCQMPERLLERIIRCCSDSDGVILDPFAGSGSTLVVAKKLGRRWLGVEVSPDYVRQANARIAAVRAGDPVEGPEDPLISAPATPLGRRARREVVDERGIIAAFQRAAGGYSADRVLADPALNAAFIDECSRLELHGRPRDWNLTLFGLRKAGKLKELNTTKRTQLSWESMDPFAFASEIALRRMLDLGCPSLDHVLGDPVAVVRFDEFARSLAPGFSSLQYRWAALSLRKAAHRWRRASARVDDAWRLKDWSKIRLDESNLTLVRPMPAVYQLAPCREDARPVYIGETWDLFHRAERTLRGRSALDQLVPNSGEWELRWFELEGVKPDQRRGLQSLLIANNQPPMNYLELAAQDA